MVSGVFGAKEWVLRSRVLCFHRQSFYPCEFRCFSLLARANSPEFSSQLSATDVSARTTMKGAAKCDKHCDLQNSVNQQGFERILRFRDTPESMPGSVSTLFSCRCSASPSRVVAQAVSAVRVCASGCALPFLAAGTPDV